MCVYVHTYVHKFSMQDQHSSPLINQLLTMAPMYHVKYNSTAGTLLAHTAICNTYADENAPSFIHLVLCHFRGHHTCVTEAVQVLLLLCILRQSLQGYIRRTVTVNELCTVECGWTCIIQIRTTKMSCSSTIAHAHTYTGN